MWTLYVSTILLLLVGSTESYTTIPSSSSLSSIQHKNQQHVATHSNLFRSTPKSIHHQHHHQHNIAFQPSDSFSSTLLQMTENKDENNDVASTPPSTSEEETTTSSETSTSSVETTNTDSTTTTTKTKERSGFITALFIGPPLIFKFLIVLAVKFLTDVIVFPLLLLFRLAKLTKNRILEIFSWVTSKGDSSGGDDDSLLNGEQVNGN